MFFSCIMCPAALPRMFFCKHDRHKSPGEMQSAFVGVIFLQEVRQGDRRPVQKNESEKLHRSSVPLARLFTICVQWSKILVG